MDKKFLWFANESRLSEEKKYNYPLVITEKMAEECIKITLQHVLNLWSKNINEFSSVEASVEPAHPTGQSHRMSKSLFVKISDGNIVGIMFDLKAILAPVREPTDEEKAKEDWYELDG